MGDTVTGWRSFAVEPVIFAYMFAMAISENVVTDLIIYQTCKTMPNMNESICDNLHKNSSSVEAMKLGKLVQPHAAPIIALKSFFEFSFPAFLVLFLGPWSDKNGRKVLLVFPLLGDILRYSGYALVTSLNLNSYWLLLPSIPVSLFGGFSLLGLAVFCWVTDVTHKDFRAWRLARVEAAILMGRLLGLFASPEIFQKWGYVCSFSTSAVIYLVALVYTILFVGESVETNGEWTLSSIFDFSLIKQLLDSVVKKREGFDRFVVWSCLVYLAMYHAVLHGILCLSFLFTSSHLGWNLWDFCLWSGVRLVSCIGGLLLLVKIFASICKLPEVFILITSCLSSGASSVTIAFVTQSWQMYLASTVGMFSPVSSPVIKSIMSKAVPNKDFGKVFSLITLIELLVPMGTEPLYIFVYVHTINLYPCPVWFVSTTLCLIMMFLAIVIGVRWKRFKSTQYTSLTQAQC